MYLEQRICSKYWSGIFIICSSDICHNSASHLQQVLKWHLQQLCIAFAASIQVTFSSCIQSHLQQLCIAFDSRPKHFKWLHLVQCQFIKPTQNITTPNYSNVNLLQRLIPSSSRSHDLLIVYTALSCLGHKYKQNQKKKT